MPLVSVIVPAYNASAHLDRAVRSALTQDGAEVEVIVIDDASTDATPEVVRRLREEDGRVRAVRFEENRGPAAARNAGIEAARGGWIALLDSDDYWEPGRLEYLLGLAGSAAGDRQVDVVCDDVLRLTQGTVAPYTMQTLRRWKAEEGHILQAHELCVRDFIPKPMIRASFLREMGLRFPEGIRWGEDFLFFLELLLHGARWVVGRRAFYVYVQQPDSLITSPESLPTIRAADQAMLDDPRVQSDPRLHAAFKERLSMADWAAWKLDVWHAVQRCQWLTAVLLLAGSPQHVPRLLEEQGRKLPQRLSRRRRVGS